MFGVITRDTNKEYTIVKYVGELDGLNSFASIPVYNISAERTKYYTPGKDWEKRTKFNMDRQFTSHSGLQRSDPICNRSK